jgi:hypothetical protein
MAENGRTDTQIDGSLAFLRTSPQKPTSLFPREGIEMLYLTSAHLISAFSHAGAHSSITASADDYAE